MYLGPRIDFEIIPSKVFMFTFLQLYLGSVHILRHLPRGGGGFQKMTLDDGGEGGFMVR